MTDDMEKCAHPACACHRTEDSKYCSAYCADAKDTTELACGCGHAGCGTDAVVSAGAGETTMAV